MKYLFLLLGLLFNLPFLNAQIQKLAVHQVISSFQLDLINDTLILLKDQNISDSADNITEITSRLSNNELLIQYQLTDTDEKGYYMVYLEIQDENKNTIEPHAGFLLGDFGKIETLKTGKKTITWTNLLAQLPHAKGKYQIILEIEKWGNLFLPFDVDCDEYPTFAFSQKLPYYTGLAVGVGGIVTGVVLRNNAQKHFDRHKISNALSERRAEYNRYTSQLKTAEVITYVGIGIIAVDAFFYFLRKGKYNRQIRIFEEYCNKEQLSFSPIFELPTTEKASNIGLHLSYQF